MVDFTKLVFGAPSAKCSVRTAHKRISDYHQNVCCQDMMFASFLWANRFSVTLYRNHFNRENKTMQVAIYDAHLREETILGSFEFVHEGQLAFTRTIASLQHQDQLNKDRATVKAPTFLIGAN